MKLSKFQHEWFLFEVFRKYCDEFDIVSVDKNESPDFICTDVNGKLVGVEITESMLQSYGRMRSIFNKYANKGLNIRTIEQQINTSKKDSSFLEHGKIIKIGDITCYSPTKGLIDTKIMRVEMTKDIEKKTIKLNENYEVFDNNILIISPNGCFLTSDYDHMEVLTEINALIYKYKYTFNSIYIYMLDVLHCYKRKENEYIRNEMMIDSEIIKYIISTLVNK